jgi:hypothetical protein
MSDVIDFLEKWGRDAQLRHAADAELTRGLVDAQIEPLVRKALLGADQRHLEFLLGARSNVCCLVYSPDKEEEEEEEEVPEEESEEEEEKDDKVKKSEDRVRRIA